MTIMYNKPDLDYKVKKALDNQDFSNRADKTMHKESLPFGLYGYTFLGENFMVISDKLVSGFSYITGIPSINYEQGAKTQIHEAIHPEWEYQCRVITDWITDITLSGMNYLKEQYENTSFSFPSFYLKGGGKQNYQTQIGSSEASIPLVPNLHLIR